MSESVKVRAGLSAVRISRIAANPRVSVRPGSSAPVTVKTAGVLRIIEQVGGGGGGGGAQQVFVQPTQPVASGPWLWVQTGLAPAGAGFTLWFEDGQP